MFLFLSKVLPLLLIYPLGLSCLLMLVALGMLWKYPKKAAIPIALALVVLLVSGNGWVSDWLVRSLEWQHIPSQELPVADAVVVLGGGIKEWREPRPWPDLSEGGDRIVYGAQLYNQYKASILILSGGRIDWQKGTGPSESKDMAEIAEYLGVPRTAIIQDPNSLNTHENAVNVRKIMDERGINRVLLVTSAMHMPRAIGTFEKEGIDATPAPTDFLATKPPLHERKLSPGEILLNIIPDVSRLGQTTKAFKEYMGMVIYSLQGWL
ncbi:MAG: YdcF family protein [Hormoscilla sp. SP5CHS1]|nr:YdcF family protein [Hormoscilla sp. SP5CHS1]